MHRTIWMGGLVLALSLLLQAPLVQAQAASAAASTHDQQGVVEKVEKAVVHGAKTAASAVARGAKAAASGVERGVKAAASGVQRGAKAAASGVQRGAHATAKAVDSVASKVVGPSSASSAASKPAD